MTTNNGDFCYEGVGNSCLEFFSEAASLFKKRQSYYGKEKSALDLFIPAYKENKLIAMRLLFWSRDARKGGGNRSGFRSIIKWLAKNEPEALNKNLSIVPKYGRYDDFRVLFGKSTVEAQAIAAKLWAQAIVNKDALAAKWADRNDKPILWAIRELVGTKIKVCEFRKMLSALRKDCPEVKMSANEWENINYSHVPSVCMSRNTKAFKKHDGLRFEDFIKDVKAGKQKVNAGAMFPHDCIRSGLAGEWEIAEAQFYALPNFLDDQRILCVCDTSGSMGNLVSGTIRAVDVSTSLSLYCSSRLSPENPFYKKFLQFKSESSLTDWNGMTLEQCFNKHLFNGAVGSTDIYKALMTLLNHAKMFKCTKDQMPTALMIISDMQFDEGVKERENPWDNDSKSTTAPEVAFQEWNAAGYDTPKVIYWNTAGYAGAPARFNTSNIAMLSGFSPASLKELLKHFDPIKAMMAVLEKYSDVIV